MFLQLENVGAYEEFLPLCCRSFESCSFHRDKTRVRQAGMDFKEAHAFRATFLKFCPLIVCLPHYGLSSDLSKKKKNSHSQFSAMSVFFSLMHLQVLEAVCKIYSMMSQVCRSWT